MNKQSPNGRDSLRSAFTLIELLVVVAIVGVLAALLLTVVSRSKGKALRIQCSNNVRQLGIGLQAFLADVSAFPLRSNPGYRNGAYPAHYTMWMIALQYAEFSFPGNTNRVRFSQWSGEGVWKCPAAKRPTNWPKNSGYESYGYNSYGLSATTDSSAFGLGGHHGWGGPEGTAPPVSESEVVNPSGTLAIGDGFLGDKGIVGDGSWDLWRSKAVTKTLGDAKFIGSTKRSQARHQGRANVVFCDGHVESLTLKTLFEDTSDEALSRWNRDHQPHRELLPP